VTFSVWDPDHKRFDYYQTAEGVGARENPEPNLPKREMGVSPEQAAWRLPSEARKVGSGDRVQGAVAARSGLGDTASVGGSVFKLLGLGLIAYGAWKLIGKATR
jgi:hypothetical protein